MKILLWILILIPWIQANAGEWTQQGYVNNLRIYDGEYLYGQLDGVTLPCGQEGFRLVSDLVKETTIISLLLIAQTTGKKVKLFYEDSECEANPGNTLIRGAWLVD